MITEFNKGVWVAVEYLVLIRDEPTFAKEIIQQCGISLEDAVEIVKDTNYQAHKIIDVLLKNNTWALQNLSTVNKP